MKSFAMVLLGMVVLGLGLTGCGTTGDPPPGPVSTESNMPWNTPQPGEGSGMFGGVFSQDR
jgi:hypothetical protein